MRVRNAQQIVADLAFHLFEHAAGQCAIALRRAHVAAAIPAGDEGGDRMLVRNQGRIDGDHPTIGLEETSQSFQQRAHFVIVEVMQQAEGESQIDLGNIEAAGLSDIQALEARSKRARSP